MLAISVQIFLRLDRADLAEAKLAELASRDDESALYQLSAAHTYLALGGDKAKEVRRAFRRARAQGLVSARSRAAPHPFRPS